MARVAWPERHPRRAQACGQWRHSWRPSGPWTPWVENDPSLEPMAYRRLLQRFVTWARVRRRAACGGAERIAANKPWKPPRSRTRDARRGRRLLFREGGGGRPASGPATTPSIARADPSGMTRSARGPLPRIPGTLFRRASSGDEPGFRVSAVTDVGKKGRPSRAPPGNPDDEPMRGRVIRFESRSRSCSLGAPPRMSPGSSGGGL